MSAARWWRIRHVDKVSLTGSVPTGRRVMAEAGAGVKHATMELGGKSPLIIFEDAELEDAISAAMLGNFYSAGRSARTARASSYTTASRPASSTGWPNAHPASFSATRSTRRPRWGR